MRPKQGVRQNLALRRIYSRRPKKIVKLNYFRISRVFFVSLKYILGKKTHEIQFHETFCLHQLVNNALQYFGILPFFNNVIFENERLVRLKMIRALGNV